jgi:hypothetical protein
MHQYDPNPTRNIMTHNFLHDPRTQVTQQELNTKL